MKVSGSVNMALMITEELLESLDELTVKENHLPEKIFNMNETTLP